MNEIGNDHADQSVVGDSQRPARLAAIGKRAADLHAVIDQSYLRLRNALLDQLAHDRFRVSDHRVHPSVQPVFELCDQRPVALIIGEAAPAHDLDRHARRDGDMRADQIRPGKIEVSDFRAPAPHEPVELVGGKRDMRRVTHNRSLVPCQPRRGATSTPAFSTCSARSPRSVRQNVTTLQPTLQVAAASE